MASMVERLANAARILTYRAHRKLHPKNWIHTLSESELEREVGRWYYSERGYHMDFSAPRSFSEKMQWLKVHDKDPRKAVLADKLAVRDEITRKVGSEVLPQVYRSWDDAASISFEGLPKRFFLKCNNGSGMMARIEDSSTADMDALRKKAAEWLAYDFSARYFEMHYADITPRVYAEEWIDDIEWEYQAWCFSGEIAFIAAIHEPHGVNEKQFFSPTWEKLPFVSSPPEYPGTIDRPACLPQLLEWSTTLADDFTFVRVDWYGTPRGLIFSEMSFTPACGLVRWVPSSYNDTVGDLMHLPIEG